MIPECHCGPRIGVASGRVTAGSAQLWPPRNEGPASVATRTPFSLPPAQRRHSGSVKRPPGFVQSHRVPKPEPRRRVQGGGAGDAQETYLTRAAFGRLRCRDQLRHSLQVIGVLLIPYREPRAVSARRGRVGRLGAGPERGTGSRQVLGPEPRGQTAPDAPRRGRAAASVQCARAAASVCVPSFPFLPR